MITWLFHLSDFDATLVGNVGSQQPFSSSAAQNIHNMDPANEAGKGRRRTYLACRQCRSRKIKCDGSHPVCLTCIRRKSLKCEYDDQPGHRGPDRRPRVRSHQDAGSFPSSRRSQKRSSNDVVASPITPPSTQSPSYITPNASANTPGMGFSSGSSTPPRGSLDSIRLNPSRDASTLFQQGSVNETPTQDLFGGSPSMRPFHGHLHHSETRPPTSNDSPLLPVSRPGSSDAGFVLNSFSILHPGPSLSTGTRDQGENRSFPPNPENDRPYPNFSPRTIADAPPHSPYFPDNDPRSSSGFRYSVPVIPIQVATEADTGQRQMVQSPHIFASSSSTISRAMNIVHSDLSVWTYPYNSFPEATDHVPPVADDPNILPMGSSRVQGGLVSNRFQDFENDGPSHEDADEFNFEEFWPPTPDTLGAHSYEMLNQPSVEFSRQMWWRSLTRYYGGTRAHATHCITDDLSHFFRVTHSLFSFINLPLFFSTFHHPSQREHVQPSLVFAMLALSTLFRSTDIVGLGEAGRFKALELRNLAQNHFDMSLNSGWITPDLAKAALLLMIFESSCHPAHSESRALSALFLFDSLILGLGLLDLDKDERNVTAFNPNSVHSLFSPSQGHIGQAAIGQGAANQGCSCSDFQLSTMSPSSLKLSPLWATGPGWGAEWDDVETRREEQRRVVWSALPLTSLYMSYYGSLISQSLHIAKPWNFKVLFPGEKLFGPPQMRDGLAAKQSTWALRSWCPMLYIGCLSVHYDESMSEYDKGQFAVQAWLESERIQKLLDMHTCDIERANFYFGRQILFDIKNLVSSHYSRYIPHPSIGDPRFHRDEALSWLYQQKNVMRHSLGALSRIKGLKENPLATRPYLTFWFHNQLDRYLDIWKQDPTLHLALDLCIQLLPTVECLMVLFPSNYPRQKYETIHLRLVDACIRAGISPPPHPSYMIL
ncbi:hypothetical protein BS47DRAFT_1312196 [Hydnum rufescens UP504]|uniref:Zn(2)-C6 fungal-type domain-containing protein n=1 Tax=Hydnum rufescens UP504 TaxID=1448309 RepID=A0A9P6B894_9AGAM|nr:hypothetical protein BS47DRAFT_1312196 [Hydnum rufescens UP504]